MLEIFLNSLIIAVIAVVYIKILAFQDVLNWWFKIGLKFEKKWFYSIIWGCQLCFAGQLSLWIYVFNWIGFQTTIFPELNFEEYSIFYLIFFICNSIFITFLISKIYDFTSNKL